MSCKHPSLYNSMCVVCGMKVVPTAPSNSKTANSAPNQPNGGYKLSLNMSGGKVLQLSAEEAASVTASKVSNLRNSKKLALVLDLDHTLLHAIQVEGQTPSRSSATARVIEGTKGIGSGNGVEDNVVHHLPIEEIDRFTVKHLVMKKRPHLDEFLEKASEFCQMTVYTAGTRRYAEAVAKVIDPSRKYFADRIVSRCDVANIRADGNDKSLERIFPGDASMAVIIDDREDVWRGPQGQQLLLVKPFVHFDPRPNEASPSSASQPDNASTPPPDALNTISRGVAAPGGGGNNSNGPPLIMSPVITLCGSTYTGGAAEPAGRIAKVAPLYSFEHSSLDDQLPRCLQVLLEIHAQYYRPGGSLSSSTSTSSSHLLDTVQDTQSSSLSSSGGPSAAPADKIPSSTSLPAGTPSLPHSASHPQLQQSVGGILQDIKKKVLAGCTLTFSGLIPTNEGNPRNHTLWRLAEALGAQVSTELLPRTTHLISIHTQTAKVSAVLQKRASEVWVLHPDWLIYCRWSLSRCCEATFMLNQLAPGQALPSPPMDFSPLPVPPAVAAGAVGVAVAPALAAPITATAVVATVATSPSNRNGATGVGIGDAGVSASGGVSVPVAAADANSKKRGREEEGNISHNHGSRASTGNSTSGGGGGGGSGGDENDMLSALKRLKAVGPIGTAEKDMYSFARKYNVAAPITTPASSSSSSTGGKGGSGDGAHGNISSSNSSVKTAMSGSAGARSALFAHSNITGGINRISGSSSSNINSNSNVARGAAPSLPLHRPSANSSTSSSSSAPIRKKSGTLLELPDLPLAPNNPTLAPAAENGTETETKLAPASASGDQGSSGKVSSSRSKDSSSSAPVLDATRLARKAQGKHSPLSPVRPVRTVRDQQMQPPADERYYIQYDYENSKDRYFSLSDSGDSGGDDDINSSSAEEKGKEEEKDMAAAAEAHIYMHNDNDTVSNYDPAETSSSRGSRGRSSSEGSAGRSGGDNDSAGSAGEHSLMGYGEDPAVPDDDDNDGEGEGYFLGSSDQQEEQKDINSGEYEFEYGGDYGDTMDVGDEGQCCNDDNGSTCSATSADNFGDSERALNPCSSTRQRHHQQHRQQHAALEDGEVAECETDAFMAHYRQQHRHSTAGAAVANSSSNNSSSSFGRPSSIHRISSTTSSNSASNSNSKSASNNNSSAEDDDCSDFEVMINRRRRSASNTEAGTAEIGVESVAEAVGAMAAVGEDECSYSDAEGQQLDE